MATASQTSLRLPEDINARLNTLAQRTGRSKTFYIMEAIKEHLANLENSYADQQVIVHPGSLKKEAPQMQKSRNIAELLAMPDEVDFDFEIPEPSREIIEPADLS